MAKGQASTIERRITRSSANSDAFRELPAKKKRKIELENDIQETPMSSRTAQNEETSLKKEIRLPTRLPDHLITHFGVQKQTALRALKDLSLMEFNSSSEAKATEQLKELIDGTVSRQEGNSCLILGPRGSGKNKLVESSISSFKAMARPPIIIRLSGHSQLTDRLAMREILRQIQEQSGIDVFVEAEEGEDHMEYEEADPYSGQEIDLSLPPTSRLPQLIGSLPNLGRPVILILDAFDKFTEHARQALLYCLLDTVQSCRGELADNHADPAIQLPVTAVTRERGKATASRKECGLLVIGITSRIDCLALLEKRVKSRFSHRVLRVNSCHDVPDLLQFFKKILSADSDIDHHIFSEEWQALWLKCVEVFFSDAEVQAAFKEIYSFSKDIRSFTRVLVSSIASLTPDAPWLKSSVYQRSINIQRNRNQFPFLKDLAYPHLFLLIAAMHVSTAGQETFTFELLYDKYITQVNLTASAPVNSERGEINMPFMSRNVLLGAFENLVNNCIFHPAMPYASHISKEFMRYHCKATREDVKNIIDETGHPGIRKWFYKSQ